MALAAIYSFLADRFQATDFEGALTINMLKVHARPGLSIGYILINSQHSYLRASPPWMRNYFKRQISQRFFHDLPGKAGRLSRSLLKRSLIMLRPQPSGNKIMQREEMTTRPPKAPVQTRHPQILSDLNVPAKEKALLNPLPNV